MRIALLGFMLESNGFAAPACCGPGWIKGFGEVMDATWPAYSGDCDRLIRPMVITQSG